MFDYWLERQDESYQSNTQASTNALINADHQLYFTSKSIGITDDRGQQNLGEGSGGASDKNINSWTGSSASSAGGPRTGIVENKLGNDGYPVLASGSKYSSNASGRTWSITTEESLGYLFNTNEFDGKGVYENVTGLFQLNEQGSYYYDSTQNFASLVDANGNIGNNFTLYEKPAVNADATVADRSNGQFFPFNSANQVFTDGSYQTSNITSSDSRLNHFFGMHASATFMQPEEGKVAGGGDMVFDFSGDDDVWVFIDGVLVGDVSGIHDALQLTINFATGDVVVKNAAKNADQTLTGNHTFSKITIAGAFKAAGVTSNALEGNTFKSGTYHKLDFFYLERGGGNSNMKLTSNLASIPETEVTKVDQNGAAVPGASFKLYAANENGTDETSELIGEGTTDHNGKISFTSNGVPVNFTDLANTDHITNYVLEETAVPNGYRTSSTTSWLQYVTGENGTGFLISMDPWKSGTWAAPREKLTINNPEILKDATSSETHNLNEGGEVYAVVLKRVDTSIPLDNPANASNWKAVKGDPISGWVLSDKAITDTSEIDPSFLTNAFEKDGDGRYACMFDELPGDPRDYYYFAGGDTADRQVQYSITYYYEDASGARHRLDDTQFSRQYAANLFVGNMQNRLLVQKVDDAGNAVDGAVFGLYTEDQTQAVDGKRVLKDGMQPVLTADATQTLNQEKNGIDLEGGAIFSGLNTNTTYYLGEVSVPAGYVKKTALTEVRVDENGVHANAGVKDDGIETLVGAGAVVKSVAQFGTSPSVDSTLHDIKISKLAGTQADDGTLTWGADNEDSSVKYLTYDPNDAALEYGPAAGSDDQSVVFTSDAGWADVKVEQNYSDQPGGVVCAGEASKVDIAKSNHSSADVSGLFTGSTIVRVANERVANERVAKLEVTKKVEADVSLSPDPNAGFTFKFTFPDDKEYDAQVFDAEGNPVGDPLKLSNKGHSEQTITADQSIRVYGLETGKNVTVEELDSDGKMPAGFAFTKSADAANPNDDKSKSVTVTIADPTETAAAPANRLEFTNTYDVSDLTNVPSFAAEKKLLEKTGNAATLEDKTWTDADVYTMRLSISATHGYRMPNGTEAELAAPDVPLPQGYKPFEYEDVTQYAYDTEFNKNKQELTVNNLTFKKPGTYTFYFYEVTPAQNDQVVGTKYSNALYEVEASVKDTGSGSMYVQQLKMTRVNNDGGDKVNESVCTVTYNADGSVTSTEPENGNLLGTVTNVFTHNTFNAFAGGYKVYNNTTNGPDFKKVASKFTYTVTPVSNNDSEDTAAVATMPAPDGKRVSDLNNGTTWSSTVGGQDHLIAFDELSFENPTDVGHTYVYRMTEDIPGNATNVNVNNGKTKYSEVTDPAQKQQAGWKLDGITYDSSVYEVTYVIGWDDQKNEVTANVTWAKDGKPYSLPVGDANPAAGRIVFTNSYAAEPVAQNLSITKTLTGRDWTAGETFSFTLTEDASNDTSGYTLPVNGKLSIKQGDNAAAGEVAGKKDKAYTFDYGAITFRKAGTYKFIIKETVGKDGEHGLAYDKSEYKLTLIVVDNVNGTLTVEDKLVQTKDKAGNTIAQPTEINSKVASFVNVYTAKAENGTALLSKELKGRDWQDGDSFTFHMEKYSYKADANAVEQTDAEALKKLPEPAGNVGVTDKTAGYQGASGTTANPAIKEVRFDEMKFDAPGVYIYTVTEFGPDGQTAVSDSNKLKNGVTYDSTKVKVTFTVTDLGNGHLNVDVAYDSSVDGVTVANFTNVYGTGSGAEVSTDALFSKTLTGRDWFNTDAFNFTLTAETEGAPLPQPSNGVTIADSKAQVTVTKPVEAATAKFGFGTFAFTDADMEGATENAEGKLEKQFVYKVTEDETNLPVGVRPKVAGKTATLTITVTDDGKGALSAKAAVSTVENGDFVNVYSTSTEYSLGALLNVTKTLIGRDMTEGQFSFTMAAADDASAEKLGVSTDGIEGTDDAALNGAVADVTFADLANKKVTFSNGDAGNTYALKIVENGENGKGYTLDTLNKGDATVAFAPKYDAATAKLTVEVTVAKDSKQIDTATLDGAEAKAVTVAFENKYAAIPSTLGGEGEFAIKATKQLTNKPLEGNDFTFNMVNKLDVNEGTKTVATGTNNAEGAIKFGGIEYTTEKLESDAAASLNKREKNADGSYTYTYEYTVNEVEPAASSGVSMVTHSLDITVKVIDKGEGGKLNIEVIYPGNGGGLTFVNEYGETAEKPLAINGSKVLVNESGDAMTLKDIAGKYTFTLKGSEGAPMPSSNTASNDEAGNVSFGEIVYTMENVFGDTGDQVAAVADEANDGDEPVAAEKRTKTFTYEVTESGKVTGVDNEADTNGNPVVHSFTVTVTDNGDGTIDVATDPATGALFTFTNMHRVTPEPLDPTGENGISVSKKLIGRDMAEGEFAFELANANGDVVAKGANAAAEDGQSAEVKLEAVEGFANFTEPGYYVYTLREVVPAGGESTKGVTYDTNEYKVVAEVSEGTGEAAGTLSVQWRCGNENKVSFTNTYTAQPTSFQVNAAKYLEGRDLAEGEFTFELREGDKVLQTVTNGADGDVQRIKFDAIPYDSVGEHDYSIVEVPGEAEGVTYDDTVFTYHVSVVDNGKGQLEVNWTEGETGAPVFENSYEAPAEPDPEPAEPEPSPEVPESENPEEPPAPEVPDTGDRANVAMPVAIALAGVAVVGVAWVTSRRRCG